LAVLDDVFGAGVGVERLAPLHLGVDGGEHTVHRRFVEVGDNIHAVGQLAEGAERAAAFVIDQHKVENIGRVVGNEAMPTIIVISSSDFPEPVPPAIRPWTPSVLADMCSVRGRLPEMMPSV
jgi:hypothetical protein